MSCICTPTTHTIIFQQLDTNAYPLPDTSIPVKLSIYQQGNRIEIQFPDINFQTQSIFGPANDIQFVIVAGGSLGTLSDPLPECLRPNTIKTFSCSNNDAYLAAFSITVPPPTILSAFNLIIDTYGKIRITGAGSYAGIIPTGGHTFNSQSVVYYVEQMICPIKKSFIIDPGFTDVTQFGGPFGGQAQQDGIRDSHVNDNFNGVVATSWTGNSDQNKTFTVMNLYVALGNYNLGGLTMGSPQNLTNFNPTVQPVPGDFTFSWDSAVAINRKNPNVVVASIALFQYSSTIVPLVPAYFISTLGGQPGSWSGPILLDPVNLPYNGTNTIGDCRGVLADDDGNFWYSLSIVSLTDVPLFNLAFYFSSDQGNTWTNVYQTTDSNVSTLSYYDYPQIIAGTDGKGNPGLWFHADYISFIITGDYTPRIGFIPATGTIYTGGVPGDGIMQTYPNQVNNLDVPGLAIDDKGTLYMNSWFAAPIYTNYTAQVLTIKNPPNATVTDPLDQSLLQYSTTIQNASNNLNTTSAFPGYFWFGSSVNTLIYDNSRQVLYSILNEQPDINSQDFYMYMKISFNKGVNFSPSIQISGSHKNNRGFASMALDECSGTMIITWYSGQNSPTATQEQFFGLFLSKKKLDRIVKCARNAIV